MLWWITSRHPDGCPHRSTKEGCWPSQVIRPASSCNAVHRLVCYLVVQGPPVTHTGDCRLSGIPPPGSVISPLALPGRAGPRPKTWPSLFMSLFGCLRSGGAPSGGLLLGATLKVGWWITLSRGKLLPCLESLGSGYLPIARVVPNLAKMRNMLKH